MLKSETITKLVPALLAAQKEFPKIVKASDNPYFKSKYAELPDILDAVNPVLHRHGLMVLQGTNGATDGHINVETAIFHESGEYISSCLDLKLAKDDPQGAGSGITYARRYGVCLALNLAPDKDDDGNAASGKVVESSDAKAVKPATVAGKKPSLEAVLAKVKEKQTREDVQVMSAKIKKISKEFSLDELKKINEALKNRLSDLAGTGQND